MGVGPRRTVLLAGMVMASQRKVPLAGVHGLPRETGSDSDAPGSPSPSSWMETTVPTGRLVAGTVMPPGRLMFPH